MTSTHFVNRQRTNLGLTQDELAGYLNISRSLLALVERHERELPTPAHLLLMELVVNIESEQSAPAAQERPIADPLLTKRIQDKEWQLRQLRQQYERLNNEYQNKKRRREVFVRTLEKLSADDQGKERKARFLQKQIDTLNGQLFTRYRVDLIVVQASIAALETEIKILKQLSVNNAQ